MILLVDASAAVDLLVRSDAGERVRRFLAETENITLMTVAHLDAEVLSALARLHRGDVLNTDEATGLLDRLAATEMRRPTTTRSTRLAPSCVPISNPMPANSNTMAVLRPRSPAGWQHSSASTAGAPTNS